MPISLEGLAAGETELAVEFMGETCVLTYDPNAMSKQFRAEVLRLQRAYTKVKRRMDELLTRATTVQALDGTPEAELEDEAAEAAIKAIQDEDTSLKAQIDAAIASIVTAWDLTYTVNGTKTIPIYQVAEGERIPHPDLARVPVEFEAEVLNAIIADGTSGEAGGARTLNSSASTSKPVEKQATLRPRQIGQPRSRRQRAGRALNRGNG